MKVNSPEVKMLMMDVLTFTGNLNEKGEKERRSSIYRKVYNGFNDLKKSLISGMEIGCVDSSLKDGEKISLDLVKFLPTDSDFSGKRIVGERHTNKEIELSDKMIEALKHYASEREELPEVSKESYEEFERIIA